MNWYRITLSRQEFEAGELAILQGAFQEAYIARNAPAGMALFGMWNDERSAYFVYVTPRSVPHVRPLLDAYSAEALDPPDRSRLSLIFGDESGRAAGSSVFEA
jgi:hypothetical protein